MPGQPVLQGFEVKINDRGNVERKQLGDDQSAHDGQAQRLASFFDRRLEDLRLPLEAGGQ
jgi:hypothetical protein